ncbi:hypothetical protein ACE10Z_19460 [Bradyrhizobium sp. Pha-3]|uniref:hypothetical protein n=1 Tax=Bradyrhizobium sp. Pha-3 TaxID=208375 RepID=UPI0035D43F5F
MESYPGRPKQKQSAFVGGENNNAASHNPDRRLRRRIAGLAPGSFAYSTPEYEPLALLEKAIGQIKPEVVPSRFVINSRSANLKDGQLVLVGVSPTAIVFADTPVRAAALDLTTRIVEDWGNGSDNFAKDPPNVTVSGFKEHGSSVADDVAVVLNRASPYPLCH